MFSIWDKLIQMKCYANKNTNEIKKYEIKQTKRPSDLHRLYEDDEYRVLWGDQVFPSKTLLRTPVKLIWQTIQIMAWP